MTGHNRRSPPPESESGILAPSAPTAGAMLGRKPALDGRTADQLTGKCAEPFRTRIVPPEAAEADATVGESSPGVTAGTAGLHRGRERHCSGPAVKDGSAGRRSGN
nr:uncharacterized protein LOC109407498 [Aedes albopictus]